MRRTISILLAAALVIAGLYVIVSHLIDKSEIDWRTVIGGAFMVVIGGFWIWADGLERWVSVENIDDAGDVQEGGKTSRRIVAGATHKRSEERHPSE